MLEHRIALLCGGSFTRLILLKIFKHFWSCPPKVKLVQGRACFHALCAAAYFPLLLTVLRTPIFKELLL